LIGQDIVLSFFLVFVYTVVGFAFSLHALRMKIETSKVRWYTAASFLQKLTPLFSRNLCELRIARATSKK